MSKVIMIRLQPPLDKGRAGFYYLDDSEERIETGPEPGKSLKDYVGGKMEELLNAGHRGFVLDLALCKWVSSSDMGWMLAWYRIAAKRGAALVMANPSDSVKEVMTITKLDTVMKVFDGLDQARDFFSKK